MEIMSNKLSSLLLIAELLLCTVCCALVYSLSGGFLKSCYFFMEGFDKNSVKVFSQSPEQETVDMIYSLPGVKDIIKTELYYSQDGKLEAFVCDDTLFENISFEYEGELPENSLAKSGKIPALASPYISEIYGIGDTITSDGAEYIIVGKLSRDDIFHMVDNHSGSNYIICRESAGGEDVFNAGHIYAGTTFFIHSSGGVGSILSKLNSKDFNVNAAEFDWRQELSDEFTSVASVLITAVWILIITLIGFSANSYLNFRKNENSYKAMLMIGAKRRHITMPYFLRSILCVTLSLLIAVPITLILSRRIGIEYKKINELLMAFVPAAALSVLVILMSFISMRAKLGKLIMK